MLRLTICDKGVKENAIKIIQGEIEKTTDVFSARKMAQGILDRMAGAGIHLYTGHALVELAEAWGHEDMAS